MRVHSLLTSVALCGALALVGVPAHAQSGEDAEEAAIMTDEAAEAEALGAEAEAEADVVVDEVDAVEEGEEAKAAADRGEKAFMDTKK